MLTECSEFSSSLGDPEISHSNFGSIREITNGLNNIDVYVKQGFIGTVTAVDAKNRTPKQFGRPGMHQTYVTVSDVEDAAVR